jgi:hypothetical protein
MDQRADYTRQHIQLSEVLLSKTYGLGFFARKLAVEICYQRLKQGKERGLFDQSELYGAYQASIEQEYRDLQRLYKLYQADDYARAEQIDRALQQGLTIGQLLAQMEAE